MQFDVIPLKSGQSLTFASRKTKPLFPIIPAAWFLPVLCYIFHSIMFHLFISNQWSHKVSAEVLKPWKKALQFIRPITFLLQSQTDRGKEKKEKKKERTALCAILKVTLESMAASALFHLIYYNSEAAITRKKEGNRKPAIWKSDRGLLLQGLRKKKEMAGNWNTWSAWKPPE